MIPNNEQVRNSGLGHLHHRKRLATLQSQKCLSAISRKHTLRSPKPADMHLNSIVLRSERYWKAITKLATMNREISQKDTQFDQFNARRIWSRSPAYCTRARRCHVTFPHSPLPGCGCSCSSKYALWSANGLDGRSVSPSTSFCGWGIGCALSWCRWQHLSGSFAHTDADIDYYLTVLNSFLEEIT